MQIDHEMSGRRQRMKCAEQQRQRRCAGENRRASHYESVSAQGAALLKRDSQTLEVPDSHRAQLVSSFHSDEGENMQFMQVMRGDER